MRSARLLVSGLLSFGTLALAGFVVATQVGAAPLPSTCQSSKDCNNKNYYCDNTTKYGQATHTCKLKSEKYCRVNRTCRKYYGRKYTCDKAVRECVKK